MDHRMIKRIVAFALALTMVGGAVGAGYWAGQRSAVPADPEQQLLAQTEESVRRNTLGDADKDETVYVLANANGKTHKIIVSDWLRNADQADIIRDHSNLKEIENVKGEETFEQSKDGSLTWNADGRDIYYQGISQDKAPVELTVTYQLDGKEIQPEKLAGKSGHVTIRFDYQNQAKETVKVNGASREAYVPFTVITGVMLDTDRFSNVDVTNGKMENMGEQMAVVGLAFPGMQENLGIPSSELEIPDFVEISADVEDFQMENTMTLVTADLLRELDTEKLDLGDLSSSADKLEDAMHQLMDGSGQLHDGLSLLLDQSQLLVSGLGQMSLGAQALQGGAEQLDGGITQLQSGAQQLHDGLSLLNSNSTTLNDGAAQIYDGLLTLAGEQLRGAGFDVPNLTRENYAEVITGVINSLDDDAIYQAALDKVTATVKSHRSEIRAEVTKVVEQKVHAEVVNQLTLKARETIAKVVEANKWTFKAQVVSRSLGMTLREYNAAVRAGQITQEQQDAVNAAVEAAMEAEIEKQLQCQILQGGIDKLADPITEEKMKSDEVQQIIDENTDIQIEKAISEAMASDEVLAQMAEAKEGVQKIVQLKAMLDGYNGFYLGLLTYTGGVGTAADGVETLLAGADKLKGGSSQLADGAAALCDGLREAESKSPDLIGGVTQLKDGSELLSDGLTQLMKEGIQKILDLAHGSIAGMGDGLTASIRAAESYNSFSGIAKDADGAVKFIYKTDAIEVKE